MIERYYEFLFQHYGELISQNADELPTCLLGMGERES
jgi:hypothetical protein